MSGCEEAKKASGRLTAVARTGRGRVRASCIPRPAITLWSAIEKNDSRFNIIFISYFLPKRWGPLGDILLIWGGRGWYSKHFVKFWIWVY